jgi:integrase
MEAVHRQAVLEGRWGIRPLVVRSFNDAVREFLQHEEINRGDRPSTWLRIRTSMASATTFFGDKMVTAIGAGEVERYKVWRLKGDAAEKIAPVKPVTLKHDLDSLSLLFQWAIKMNCARDNPLNSVSRPSDRDAIREHILSTEEEKRYFTVATGNLYDVARLIILQGIRPEEAMHLRKSDVNLDAMRIRVVKGKSRAARRELLLTHESASILAARVGGPGEWVFAGRSHRSPITKLNCPHNRVCAKAGVEFVLYDLRHTFATRCVEAGVDIVALRDILGHTDIRTTMRYVHLSQSHKDRAMELYEGSLVKQAEVVQ